RRDERGGADLAVADGGEADLLEPFGRRVEAVALAPVVQRRVLERPHAAELAAGERHAVRDTARGRRRLEQVRGGGDGPLLGRRGRRRRDGGRLLPRRGTRGQCGERGDEQGE